MNLEQVLNELSRYGQVRIGQYGEKSGWHCGLDLFVTGKGVPMKIGSDHNTENTAMRAAMECSDRLLAALNEMKEQASRPTILPTPTLGEREG